MLVLLIIFMVTAPLIQRGIDVNLPTAVRATAIQGERVFVNVPLTFRKDRLVYLGDEPHPARDSSGTRPPEDGESRVRSKSTCASTAHCRFRIRWT